MNTFYDDFETMTSFVSKSKHFEANSSDFVTVAQSAKDLPSDYLKFKSKNRLTICHYLFLKKI